jgi:hypothetical protein
MRPVKKGKAMRNLSEADRVRANTSDEVNRRIDDEIRDQIARFSHRSKAEITQRIRELDREWDIERLLEMNASALALTGVFLGTTRSRKWLALPFVVLPFLLQHAIQGWCPPVPLLRRWGVRTRQEIDREKYGLKALRGDFENTTENPRNIEQVIRA